MRSIVLIISVPVILICMVCFGQVPQTTQLWNYNQFRNVVGVMQIKSGATLTNVVTTTGTNSGAFTTDSLIVGGGTPVLKIVSVLFTNDFGSLSALGTTTTNLTVAGANTNDSISLGLTTGPEAALYYQSYVSATNTVTLRVLNVSGAPVDASNQVYRVTVFHF